LTVDEHNQFRRTEIEQVGSNRKQNFPSLDGEHIVAFIKACINPTITPEDAIYTVPPLEKQKKTNAGLIRPKSSLIVSGLQAYRLEDPDSWALILTREKPFGIKARFQLEGPEAQFLTTHTTSFEIKLYANEVTSGKSKILTTYSAKLIQNVLVYTAPAEVPGLPSGLYRLFIVVNLSEPPIKMTGFRGKTIIQVI